MLGFVRHIRAPALHFHDLRIRLVRIHPLLVRPFLWPLLVQLCNVRSALRYHSCAQAPSNTIRSFPPCLDERLTEAPHSLPASSRPHPVSCHLSSLSTLELLAPIQIQIRELPAEVDSVSETATNGPAFALPFQGQETGAKTVSPNTASRSRALNRCAQSSRSTAFENTHPAVCSADLASSRNTASISTPQTSQTLPLEVPARVPHKKDDQDSTQPHRVESIKSLGDFSFSSSSTCDAILHRHRMSLQRNIDRIRLFQRAASDEATNDRRAKVPTEG